MIGERIKKLQSVLEDGAAALILSDSDRLYYTGFASSAGYVLITGKKAVFLIDSRYYEKAKKTVKGLDVLLLTDTFKQMKDIFLSEDVKRLYLETDTVSISMQKALKAKLDGIEITDDDRIQQFIKKARSIKSNEEINLILSAQKLTDSTFDYIVNRIKPGMTEREIMLDMEFFMRRNGSEGVAFDFIVASGKNSSMPHAVPTDKKVENGDFITMDYGAVVCGYRSDMTRTVAVGNISDKQKEVYETVLAAQKEAVSFIKSGVKCRDADKKARDILEKAGYGENFGHALGHSVGIDIHESPACSKNDETVMEKGLVMTVEPGIYIENEFGVRIEDMVIVTGNGCTDITKSPKELLIL